MAGGNLQLAAEWLLEDLKRQGDGEYAGRFYAMQANPNDSETNM